MLILVFRHSPRTPFSLLQKHRKNQCFDSILGLPGKENVVNSVVLFLVGTENTVYYNVLCSILGLQGEKKGCPFF